MITLLESYTTYIVYDDPNEPRAGRDVTDYALYRFNEATLLVEIESGSFGAAAGTNYSVVGEFYWDCAGTTRQSYVHDGRGGFIIASEADSISCGFVPSAPLTCDLVLAHQLTATATGANVTATATAAHGAVRYSLDGSTPQSSATFYDLAPGRHVLTATDAGVSTCMRSVAFTVATPPPPAAPAGPSKGVDFVRQPLWHAVSAPVGAEVLLEVWAETLHQADDFYLVFRMRKRADASGRINFRLDNVLAPLLQAVVPPVSTLATVVCRTPLLNYFVRTATVLAAGRPAAFVTSTLRTALRGGLPVDRRDIDYFAYRIEAYGQPPFLSWQPAGKSLTPGQPEWLFWLCPDTLPTLLTVRRTYVRTGFAAVQVDDETINLQTGRGPYGKLLAIPVRPRAGMDAVSVALYDPQDEAMSGLVTYPIVPATPRTRYLHFTNSLGGFDTLRTEGRLDATLEATADRTELPAVPGGAAPAAERQVFGVAGVHKIKLATGWLTVAQLAWLQELVLSREIWEQQGGRLLPVDPGKRQLAYASDENPLRGMLLEYDYAFDVTTYANLP